MIIFCFLDGFDDFWQIFGIYKWLIHENFHVSISMYKRPKIEKRGVPARKKTDIAKKNRQRICDFPEKMSFFFTFDKFFRFFDLN
jgi:hypothetical protein